jgi:hypothetical protein
MLSGVLNTIKVECKNYNSHHEILEKQICVNIYPGCPSHLPAPEVTGSLGGDPSSPYYLHSFFLS